MLALVLDGAPRLSSDYPEPRRPPGEALLRMRRAGICDTDLQLVNGYMGYRGVLGHEFVGEVIEADETRWIGRRVVADINAGCGKCADCLERDGHHCSRRTVLGILGRDGALAERLLVPERCLVAVPDAVTDEAAVFAEPLAAALHVADDLPDCERVVVLGDGKLGLLVTLGLLSTGRSVVVVGHHPHKLAIAAAAGASAVREEEASELIGAPAVVEATGSESGLRLALRLLAPRGTLVLKTTLAGQSQVDWSLVVVNELSVVGSRCGAVERAIDALAAGRIDPSPLVAARYPLSDAEHALEHAGRRGTLKVLVEG